VCVCVCVCVCVGVCACVCLCVCVCGKNLQKSALSSWYLANDGQLRKGAIFDLRCQHIQLRLGSADGFVAGCGCHEPV